MGNAAIPGKNWSILWTLVFLPDPARARLLVMCEERKYPESFLRLFVVKVCSLSLVLHNVQFLTREKRMDKCLKRIPPALVWRLSGRK